jgi:hypothetical protein
MFAKMCNYFDLHSDQKDPWKIRQKTEFPEQEPIPDRAVCPNLPSNPPLHRLHLPMAHKELPPVDMQLDF